MASSAGLWTQAVAGRPEKHACKWLKFGREFETAPTVLVESKHNVAVHGGVVDWSNAPTHPATITYINIVERTKFQVCASTLHASSADVDNALQWNWIAFGNGLQDPPKFQVCASTLHASSADVDNALQWNWI